ncbi:hypothetical protein [Streptomyces sp. S.PB5]|nr:hypothetical protein [Streptomyces sp. S.PB5]MDN3028407.1 hypothetical protein [Streptomyces sp. S.PB5]
MTGCSGDDRTSDLVWPQEAVQRDRLAADPEELEPLRFHIV